MFFSPKRKPFLNDRLCWILLLKPSCLLCKFSSQLNNPFVGSLQIQTPERYKSLSFNSLLLQQKREKKERKRERKKERKERKIEKETRYWTDRQFRGPARLPFTYSTIACTFVLKKRRKEKKFKKVFVISPSSIALE